MLCHMNKRVTIIDYKIKINKEKVEAKIIEITDSSRDNAMIISPKLN